MRIVAGKFKGKTLVSPKDQSIRPTSDRVRESLFNILEHGIDNFEVEGARVLDLFAGTGALGLEALSRGAKHCLFIENSAAARGIIRDNVEALSLTGNTRIWRRDATGLGPAGSMEACELVFCDPPYGKGLGERTLAGAHDNGWLKPGGIAVLEERSGLDIETPQGFVEIDRRNYGDTQILIFKSG